MSPLLRALKAKYRTPREALAALGLDQSLLDVSPPPNGASGAETPLAKLHSLLAQHFHGPEYSRVLELLEAANLSGHDYDRAVERKYNGEENEAEDNEVDEEELRQQRRKAMAKVADFFGRKGFSEDQIAEMLRDFPKNGLEHLGGALDKDHDEIMMTGASEWRPMHVFARRPMTQSATISPMRGGSSLRAAPAARGKQHEPFADFKPGKTFLSVARGARHRVEGSERSAPICRAPACRNRQDSAFRCAKLSAQ